MSDKDIFIAFLKQHKVFTAFKRNLRLEKKLSLISWLSTRYYPFSYVEAAFIWEWTIEGHDYWRNINAKWGNYYANR